jgi:acyl dehydratase
MMLRNRLACAVLLGAICLSLSPAIADEMPAPARMTSCAIVPTTIERRGTAPPETIRVSFMITGDHPANIVRFTAAGRAGGFRQFTAPGLFTKSVMISNRELQADPDAPQRELPAGVQCALTYIHYVDGTSWSRLGTIAF